MKTEEFDLNEQQGVAPCDTIIVTPGEDDSVTDDGNTGGSTGGNTGGNTGGGNTGGNTGGTTDPEPIRPEPIVGIGPF